MGFLLFPRFSSFGKVIMSDPCWRSCCCTLSDGKINDNIDSSVHWVAIPDRTTTALLCRLLLMPVLHCFSTFQPLKASVSPIFTYDIDCICIFQYASAVNNLLFLGSRQIMMPTTLLIVEHRLSENGYSILVYLVGALGHFLSSRGSTNWKSQTRSETKVGFLITTLPRHIRTVRLNN